MEAFTSIVCFIVALVMLCGSLYLIFKGMKADSFKSDFFLGAISCFVGFVYNVILFMEFGGITDIDSLLYVRYLGWLIIVPMTITLMSKIFMSRPDQYKKVVYVLAGIGCLTVLSIFGAVYINTFVEYFWAFFSFILFSSLCYAFFLIAKAEAKLKPRRIKVFFNKVLIFFILSWIVYLPLWFLVKLPFVPPEFLTITYSIWGIVTTVALTIYLSTGLHKYREFLEKHPLK